MVATCYIAALMVSLLKANYGCLNDLHSVNVRDKYTKGIS